MKKLKNKGVCQIFDNGAMILKTRYSSEEDCQSKINMLKRIDVANINSKPYKCIKCGDWHVGSKEQGKKYGK